MNEHANICGSVLLNTMRSSDCVHLARCRQPGRISSAWNHVSDSGPFFSVVVDCSGESVY